MSTVLCADLVARHVKTSILMNQFSWWRRSARQYVFYAGTGHVVLIFQILISALVCYLILRVTQKDAVSELALLDRAGCQGAA